MVWKIDSSGNCIFSYFCFFLSLLFVLLLEGQGLLCIIFLTSIFFFPLSQFSGSGSVSGFLAKLMIEMACYDILIRYVITTPPSLHDLDIPFFFTALTSIVPRYRPLVQMCPSTIHHSRGTQPAIDSK